MPNTRQRGVNPNSRTSRAYRYRGKDYPTLGFVINANAEILGRPPREVAKGDLSLAESAANQPVQSAGGGDAYPGHFAKVAAMGFSIANNHAFPDGNKRTAYVCMYMALQWSRHNLQWDSLTTVIVMSLVATNHLDREGLRIALILGCGLDPTDPNVD